jgi:hypothetical protein
MCQRILVANELGGIPLRWHIEAMTDLVTEGSDRPTLRRLLQCSIWNNTYSSYA